MHKNLPEKKDDQEENKNPFSGLYGIDIKDPHYVVSPFPKKKHNRGGTIPTTPSSSSYKFSTGTWSPSGMTVPTYNYYQYPRYVNYLNQTHTYIPSNIDLFHPDEIPVHCGMFMIDLNKLDE